MKKPKNSSRNGLYLTSYQFKAFKQTVKSVEISIPKGYTFNPKKLRNIAKWMLNVADWMDDQESNEFYSLTKFKEIITDPMRVLFEALRYETDEDILNEIVNEIEDAVTANIKADELTELNIFEYLKIINDSECNFWRNDFINEMIDRVNNPQPEQNEITARRLIYDYINLPDDSYQILDKAYNLINSKSDKKLLKDYISMWNQGDKPDLCSLGEIITKLYKKYPATV